MASGKLHTVDFTIGPEDNERQANLAGQCDEHLRQIERRLGVEINNRGVQFQVIGSARSAAVAVELLRELYERTAEEVLEPAKIHLYLQDAGVDALLAPKRDEDEVVVRTRRGLIRARGANQAQYLRDIRDNDLSFGIGPAGTGKTYLAVASAVEALESERVSRLLLVRPAVEAGERLGFLPGDLAQKIDPYLRPMYDALYEMLGFDKVNKLMERNVIEIAPLAYMRGRTLNEAFIILDEAQNTTVEQMKMFLTRIGYGSHAVVTGDVTQTDLPRGTESGLRQAIKILKDVKGVGFNFFTARDVVRHPLVRRIVEAYEKSETGQG